MKLLLSALLFFFSTSCAVTAETLEDLVFAPKWQERDMTQFAKDNPALNFRWTSSEKDSARSASPGKFLDINIPEAIVRMKDDKVTAIEISLFNKGDSGAGKFQDASDFAKFVNEIREVMNKRLNSEAVTRPSSSRNVSRAKGVMWKNDHSLYTLEWSETRANASRKIAYQAEFLRLVVTPLTPATAVTAAKTTAQKWKEVTHLKSDENGDKYIFDVPMVDQGQKGYCAVAVAERVLRYYGFTVDQHEVAKLAGTTSSGGTSTSEMQNTLATIASKLKLRYKTLLEPKTRELIDDYNKSARRLKKPAISLEQNWANAVDKDVIKHARAKDKSGMNRFERAIESHISHEKPLLWNVFIGWAPEPKILPQMRGGHMRLIIGYNKKEREVIFTDTWGAGHEMKKMKLDDAWTMTLGVSVMETP